MATTTPPPVDDESLHPLCSAGKVPCDLHAPGELDMRHRIALADRIHELVTDASCYRCHEAADQRAHRLQVREAERRLDDIEQALRSRMPILRRGEMLVERLLTDDAAGAYCRRETSALHADADAACAALGLLTQFH